MKGAIIVPKFYEKRHKKGLRSQVSRFLFKRIKALCGFPIIYTNAPNLKNLDVALVYATPYHNRPKMMPGILNVENVKIISYLGDLPCWYNVECQRNKKLMFGRSDAIIGGYYKKFREWYPQFVNKYELFSGFFFPYEWYERLMPRSSPIMKCLLSGSITPKYPFRYYISNMKGISKLIDIKNRSHVAFPKYPQFVNNYFCAIATSGTNSCMVSKYFEIPAAGTLLLGERKEELDILGFKPNVHYVPIARKNVIDKVRDVLGNPDKYLKIRKAGMDFVRKNHSDINRANQFKSLLERIFRENH